MLISRKIWLLVGIAMATCGAVSGFGLYGLKRVNSNVVEIAGNSVPAVLMVSDMRSNYLAMIPMVYNRATTADADKGSEIDKEITAGTDSLIKQINDYGARTTDAEESKALDEAKLGIVSFVTKIRQVSSLAAMGEAQLALAAIQ